MDHEATTTRPSRLRRVVLAVLVAGALGAGIATSPVAAAPVGPTDELQVETDPCPTHGTCGDDEGEEDDDGPVVDCDEAPQLCDLTAEAPDPGEPPTDPEVQGSGAVSVSPRFTG